MFSTEEKQYLKALLKRELEHLRKEQKASAMEVSIPGLKAEHEYGHFLEELLKKLQ